ncbi:RING finger protein 17 [Centroberyx affinis]|uniref:RING finger protein 17 n=1 Tax=Centroberyx affinis TaxID=166261 RepID=UPI003A5C2BB3
MDRGDNPSSAVCMLCGDTYTLPEDEVVGNLPRALLCGHIYCTSCLHSHEDDRVITCPECKVESTLPEAGVSGLQEDSRIIGLIYTAKMNKMKKYNGILNPVDVEKMEKAVDEALAQAAENIAQLDHILQTLVTGLAVQVKKERARLLMELDEAVDRATHILSKRREALLTELTNMEGRFSSGHVEVSRVQERMKALEIAMQMAREVRRVPSLEQYCTLDKVLETLQAPVDSQSFDMTCITMGSGLSCVLQSESLSQSLTDCLKMKAGSPKPLSETPPPRAQQQAGSSRKPSWHRGEGRRSRSGSRTPPGRRKPSDPQQQQQQRRDGLRAERPARRSSPSPGPHPRSSFAHHSPAPDHGAPDVIIEELIEEEQEQDSARVAGHGDFKALPPTGPELANDKWRSHRRKKLQVNAAPVIFSWVLVTHVVNPSHFYVNYVSEKRQFVTLCRRINLLCSGDEGRFTPNDKLETGSMVFTKWKEGVWCRATVAEVFQRGCVEAVGACPITRLARLRVFFLDYGFIKTIDIEDEDGTPDSSLKGVNDVLRRVDLSVQLELSHCAPYAIKCSLKELVPTDLRKGWSKEAQVEFRRVVGSAAVEMQLCGQDRDFLLVDLRKGPMDRGNDLPISVREYLVFIEVARFYSPVMVGRRQLLYYPPVYPKINTELNAVVTHINTPADFYIQLVDNMEFLLLTAKLQDCYSAMAVGGGDGDLHLYCPMIGQACVAHFDDKVWYRAQVIGHPGDRKVEVLYVDFGNKKILSFNDLRKIKDEFFALPAMAIHCCLSDVVPLEGESWTDTCTDRLTSLAHQKLVTVMATEIVPRNKPLPVRLFESGLDGPMVNIAELLVTEELACFRTRLGSRDAEPSLDDSAVWDPPLEDLLSAEGRSADQQTPADEDQEQLQPQLQLPACLKDLKVRVTHVRSPDSFYVQLTRNDAQLKRVCELLKRQCAPTEPQEVEWKADMFCAALINGVWERGQICSSVTSSNIAEVVRCDFGNKVKLHVSNLRPLQPDLVGSLILECTLSDIRPAGGRSTWTATACDFISYYLTGASAVMTIKELTDERPVPVVLSCSNQVGQFVSFADSLVSEGLALRERKPREAVVPKPEETASEPPVGEKQPGGPDTDIKRSPPSTPARPALIPFPFSPISNSTSPCTPPKPAPRTHVSAEKVKTQLYHPPELPCLGHIRMSVSAIGEDGVIYARTHHAECQLEQLRDRIQQSMKTLPRQKPYTWKSVLGCAVIGTDMLWYRGQLLEALGGQVKVRYVDYGLVEVENIPVVHVYPMLLCEDVPHLCMPCQLHGVNPVGRQWQPDAVALLKELLLNRCVDVQVMELPTEPRDCLTVHISLDGMALSRILCHHQHASMDHSALAQQEHIMASPVACLDDWDIDTEGLKSPEEPVLGPFTYPELPQEGQQFQVRVKHLWTPNELFLWPVEGPADVKVDAESLVEALARINQDVDSLPRLTSFPPGAPCLAEYSDGKYYRAKLMNFISTDPVMMLVKHVDFGSDDTLPTSKLRRMPAELLRFPVQALKVRVAGFKAPSVGLERDVLPYSPRWSTKAALDMIDLLHARITASVVSRQPELTVLLHNEKGELVHLPLVRSGLADLDLDLDLDLD